MPVNLIIGRVLISVPYNSGNKSSLERLDLPTLTDPGGAKTSPAGPISSISAQTQGLAPPFLYPWEILDSPLVCMWR